MRAYREPGGGAIIGLHGLARSMAERPRHASERRRFAGGASQVHASSRTARSRTAANSGRLSCSSLRTYAPFWSARSVLLIPCHPFVAVRRVPGSGDHAVRGGTGQGPAAARLATALAAFHRFPGPCRSETRRGVLQAGQPVLGVAALGDDSGDAPADASQPARCALRQVVVHRSSSVGGHLLPCQD